MLIVNIGMCLYLRIIVSISLFSLLLPCDFKKLMQNYLNLGNICLYTSGVQVLITKMFVCLFVLFCLFLSFCFVFSWENLGIRSRKNIKIAHCSHSGLQQISYHLCCRSIFQIPFYGLKEVLRNIYVYYWIYTKRIHAVIITPLLHQNDVVLTLW